MLHLIHGEKKKKKVLFCKSTRAQKCEIDEIAFFHFFISQLRRTNSPILPMMARAATVLSYHHGSEINVRYLKVFDEKKAVLGEM